LKLLQVQKACNCLRRGGVIAYPTEGVWGIGCDPWMERPVTRILQLKQRPVDKGLILVAASTQQLGPLYENLNSDQKQILTSDWSEPITWLLPDPKNLIPGWIKGKHSKVAIRISAHPIVQELCTLYGGFLVSTSANLAGKPEIRSRLKLLKQLGDKLDYVIPGELGMSSGPSTIKDLVSGEVIR